MIRITEDTKHVFLAGLLTWLLTFGGGVITFAVMQENHDVRIKSLEGVVNSQGLLITSNTAAIGQVREDSNKTLTILQEMYKDQQESKVMLGEIQGTVIRLETINEIKGN